MSALTPLSSWPQNNQQDKHLTCNTQVRLQHQYHCQWHSNHAAGHNVYDGTKTLQTNPSQDATGRSLRRKRGEKGNRIKQTSTKGSPYICTCRSRNVTTMRSDVHRGRGMRSIELSGRALRQKLQRPRFLPPLWSSCVSEFSGGFPLGVP